MQAVAPREWPSRAIHDTVAAVVRDPVFRRSVRNSLADRFLIWIGDLLHRLGEHIDHLPSLREVGIAVAFVAVVYLLVRTVMSARDRDDYSGKRAYAAGTASTNPWVAAEALLAARQYEEAAHALYRAVVASVAHQHRLRIDPSKTSGDYARELRRRNAPALEGFRKFTRSFDLAVYGRTGCDAAVLAELVRLAEPFRQRERAA